MIAFLIGMGLILIGFFYYKQPISIVPIVLGFFTLILSLIAMRKPKVQYVKGPEIAEVEQEGGRHIVIQTKPPKQEFPTFAGMETPFPAFVKARFEEIEVEKLQKAYKKKIKKIDSDRKLSVTEKLQKRLNEKKKLKTAVKKVKKMRLIHEGYPPTFFERKHPISRMFAGFPISLFKKDVKHMKKGGHAVYKDDEK